MKIKTKLGIITLLVPLATLGCQNAELVTEDISSAIIIEEEQPELETEFEFTTEATVDSTVETSSEIETPTETETEPIQEEEYKIEVLEDEYNVNPDAYTLLPTTAFNAASVSVLATPSIVTLAFLEFKK